jgi:hypothetical protein
LRSPMVHEKDTFAGLVPGRGGSEKRYRDDPNVPEKSLQQRHSDGQYTDSPVDVNVDHLLNSPSRPLTVSSGSTAESARSGAA